MRALTLPCGPRSLYRYITPQTVSGYGASSGVTFNTPLSRTISVGMPSACNAVILDINHFVADLIPSLDRSIAKHSIYQYIEKSLQLQISSQRTIEALPRGADDLKHLDLGDQSHVIVVSNQTFLQDGRQFEYTQSRHTLDKFYFSDEARR